MRAALIPLLAVVLLGGCAPPTGPSPQVALAVDQRPILFYPGGGPCPGETSTCPPPTWSALFMLSVTSAAAGRVESVDVAVTGGNGALLGRRHYDAADIVARAGGTNEVAAGRTLAIRQNANLEARADTDTLAVTITVRFISGGVSVDQTLRVPGA